MWNKEGTGWTLRWEKNYVGFKEIIWFSVSLSYSEKGCVGDGVGGANV